MMPTAIFINAGDQTITQVTFESTTGIGQRVGGWIELAMQFPNGDTLYVDENGLEKMTAGSHYFIIAGGHQPFAGNGMLVGPEVRDEDPFNGDVQHTCEQVTRMVKFFSLSRSLT